MNMKEEKNKVPEPEQVETAPQAEASAKEGMEKAIREESEKLKLKFAAKVNVITEDKDLREKLHEVVSDAVDEAVSMGQVAGVPEDLMKSVTESFENAARSLGSMSDASRASTYKRLFHNQRIITAHLMSAAQLLQLQIGDTESMVVPDPLSLFGAKGNMLAPPPVLKEINS